MVLGILFSSDLEEESEDDYVLLVLVLVTLKET